jgi:YHS domain-containing protein
MDRVIRSSIVAAFVLFIAAAVSARAGDANKQLNVGKDRLAIRGYDPVSYFESDKPAPGDEKITAEHDGAMYRFTSEDHRTKFLASPEKYLPQYGGWCATAMGENGSKVDVDPTSYKITDGRLFLFYHKLFTNARDLWVKDEAKLKSKADENWKKLTGE